MASVAAADVMHAGDVIGTLLTEVNGSESSRPAVLECLSRGTRAASVCWDMNGMVTLTCASRGRVLSSIEVFPGSDDNLPSEKLRRLIRRHSSGDPQSVAMMLAEEFVGLRIDPDQTDVNPSAYHPIANPVPASSSPLSADELRHLPPPLDIVPELVRLADSDALREFAIWCVDVLSPLSELERVAGTTQLIQALRSKAPTAQLPLAFERFRATTHRASVAAAQELAAVATQTTRAAAEQTARTYWRTEAIAYACNPDPQIAALGTFYCASVRFSRDRTELRSFAEQAIEILRSARPAD